LPTTLSKLAALAAAKLRGDPDTPIENVAGIQNARCGDIALLASPRYEKFLATTGASALVVGPEFDVASTPLPLLAAEKPMEAFEAIAAHLCPGSPAPEPGVHPTALVASDAEVGPGVSIHAYCVVEPGASIGANTILRPFAFVGRDVRIGRNCLLHPHVVVLDRCILGERVVLHSGVVIGGDGYGFETRDGVHHKLPQRGIVEIGDDVEIGANSTVDRARFGRTLIGRGTKIDNLVMIAHNVTVGEHSLLVAQSGIAGSTTLGHHVVVAAQAGLVGHIEIGEGAVIGAKAGITRSVAGGQTYLGMAGQEIGKERRSIALYRNLPELAARIRELGKTLEELKEKVKRLEAAAENNPNAG